MKEKDNDETLSEHTKVLTVAKTGVELYLINQQLMLESETEYEKNIRLVKSITFGLALLEGHKELRERTTIVLKENQGKSHKMRMNWLGAQRMYSLGSEDTGKIYVRPEEIDTARDEMREQISRQSNKNLEIIDYEIYCALMEEGIIRKKAIEEVMESNLESKFRSRLNAE